MSNKAVLSLTCAIVLSIVTLAFSQDRLQTKPIPQQVPADKLQPKQQPQPGSQPAARDAKGACPKLAFVTSSPLPSTGLGWDYKCQILASGGYPPLRFYARIPNIGELIDLGPDTSVRGLTITPSGLIQGQPEEAGYHMIRIVVEDICPSGVQRIEKKFALEVKGPTK